MKKIPVLFSFIVVVTTGIHAQGKKFSFSAGPEFAVPTFSGITSPGIGGGISLEHFFNKKIAGAISIDFNYFKGDVYGFYKQDTIHGFSILPVLAGVKYFFTPRLYASGAAGLLAGLHNAGNHVALSPGIGWLIPFSTTSKIDLGIKLVGVPAGYSFSENSFLNKGGYSFLTCRVAYVF